MKMRTLLPTLKERDRYIVFEIICDTPLSVLDVEDCIYSAMLHLLGEKGVAETRAKFLRDTFSENRGIIQCNHKKVEDVRASLALIREINGKKVIFHSLGVSGLISKAKKLL